MTHPTDTAILSDDEIDAVVCAGPAWDNQPHDIARRIERAVIERLGASDAVSSAYSLECCHLSGGWDETTEVLRGSPTQELINEIGETEGRWRIINFYDTTALARARQQGREEGMAAESSDIRKFVAQLEQEWSELLRMRDNEYDTVRQQGREEALAEFGPDTCACVQGKCDGSCAPYIGRRADLPERDARKPAEEQGLFRKFDVRRTDGSDAPSGKHYGCRYFVLDVDHDAHAIDALTAYAAACEQTHPELARDLREKWGAARQPTQKDV